MGLLYGYQSQTTVSDHSIYVALRRPSSASITHATLGAGKLRCRDALDQSSTRRPVLPDSQENHHGRCRCGRPHRPRGSPRRARDPGRQRPRRALGSRGRRRPGPVFAERAGAASPPRARPPRHRGRAQERLRGAARHRRNRGMPSGASPADVRARLERFLSSSARAIRRWRRRRDVKDRPLGRCGGAPGTTEGRRSRTRRCLSRVHA